MGGEFGDIRRFIGGAAVVEEDGFIGVQHGGILIGAVAAGHDVDIGAVITGVGIVFDDDGDGIIEFVTVLVVHGDEDFVIAQDLNDFAAHGVFYGIIKQAIIVNGAVVLEVDGLVQLVVGSFEAGIQGSEAGFGFGIFTSGIRIVVALLLEEGGTVAEGNLDVPAIDEHFGIDDGIAFEDGVRIGVAVLQDEDGKISAGLPHQHDAGSHYEDEEEGFHGSLLRQNLQN